MRKKEKILVMAVTWSVTQFSNQFNERIFRRFQIEFQISNGIHVIDRQLLTKKKKRRGKWHFKLKIGENCGARILGPINGLQLRN